MCKGGGGEKQGKFLFTWGPNARSRAPLRYVLLFTFAKAEAMIPYGHTVKSRRFFRTRASQFSYHSQHLFSRAKAERTKAPVSSFSSARRATTYTNTTALYILLGSNRARKVKPCPGFSPSPAHAFQPASHFTCALVVVLVVPFPSRSVLG